jgi:hypothetical protein
MQGERPLDPLFFVEFSLTFCGLILVWGMPEAAGAKVSDAADLGERSVIITDDFL